MLFNSFHFLLFFPAVMMVYFAIPQRHRWPFLLIASYYFYACWKIEYIFLLALSTGIDYWAGIQMDKRSEKPARWPFLLISMISNLGILFSFKYFNFVNENIRAAFQAFNIFYDVPAFEVLLPVGISFYTFQSLGYSVDVYRGKQKAEKNLGIFALYISFFPQLVAGPIERSQRLLPQFRKTHEFDYDRVTNGLRLMAWGFFKKLVIADRLAIYVDQVYNNPDMHTGWPIILATYFFAFQVYCDFSGYSDIAIGAGRVLGYDLMINFKRPFLAKNIGELWQRWHISLTTWLKSYLFYTLSLGGHSTSKTRWITSMFITFIAVGFWHGAKWTFIVLGMIHGSFLVSRMLTYAWREKYWQRFRKWFAATFAGNNEKAFALKGFDSIRTLWSVFITFQLFSFSCLFFRGNSMADVYTLLNNMLDFSAGFHIQVSGFNNFELMVSFAAIAFLMLVHIFEEVKETVVTLIATKPLVFRWAIYITFCLTIILFGKFEEREFIYFQF